MTATEELTWRPFHDEPLVTAELLQGVDDMPDAVRSRLTAYLEQVAEFRRAPLHVTTAFNALHFGFDLETGGYRAAVLDPELFVRVAPSGELQPPLPVGTFVRLERGQQSLWAEVVARFGAHPGVDADGWVPPALSGAPHLTQATNDQPPIAPVERVVLDPEAFGAPLTPAERAELNRLRRRGVLLDDRGHVTGPVRYTDYELVDLDDTALYARDLLTMGKPLLVGGPLGGLLSNPEDDEILAAALYVALETVDELLTQSSYLRRWGAYATPVARYGLRRARKDLLGGADLDELAHATIRLAPTVRFTGIWPLLARHVDAAQAADPDEFVTDPLELTAAAEAVVHANLALTDLASAAIDGLLPNGVHLRVDDLWQAGGVWRAQHGPVPAHVLEIKPLLPLGLGYRQSLFETDQGDEGTGHHWTRNPNVQEWVDETRNSNADAEDAETEDGGQTGIRDTGIYDATCAPPIGERVAESVNPVVEGEPAHEPEPATDAEAIVVEHLDDSLVVYTVGMREAHLNSNVLPLPYDSGGLLAKAKLIVELHHDGGQLPDADRVHRVEHDSGRLTGIEWPLSFYPGIKVTVAFARGARRLSATTSLLAEPLPFGEAYRWAADVRLLAATLGLERSEGSLPLDRTSRPSPGVSPVNSRYQGIDPLQGLVIAALRRHGTEGAFGARRLTGPQLLVALFGDELVNPALMWQVTYTCERLVDAEKLTQEPNLAQANRPGGGGPDTFVWWPSQAARKDGERQATGSRRASLRGQIREHWVPPGCRVLPDGYRASYQAKQAYARYIRALRGPAADLTLPAGYTFVRGHTKGRDPGPIWLPLAVGVEISRSR